MKCPECGTESRVTETREVDEGNIRRRRECAKGHRFSTVEVVAEMRVGFVAPSVLVMPPLANRSRVMNARRAKRATLPQPE